ncbi:N-acetylglucosamine-specific PTS transporter subunit IIBC [Gottfriedia solisilvae]|uniref:PTS system N-acetylglucosamine-specific EIICB component n=1 Tax=Gottfriedia solisilvae TaxID=1516104 RepID=A0A8J3EZR0_9BACI|nr:N-acetylglucosamine-specific PTS transporter subunit IIBC [Gottfriedia solisilvae]GGI14701.1 PTS system N-acetylglucosamine-specific EIICB component [Gottfriedia solisilvae]
MLSFLQRIGKALMLPIAVLPAAGLLLRFGQPDLLDIPFMAAAGNAIFSNLALIFAIGVAIGISKDGNGAAGLAGAIGYFVLTAGATSINKDINMAALGGIIAGVIAGLLYNRFSAIKLPEWLGFFSGRRFVPIITSAVMLILAGLFGYIWPSIQDAINSVGNWIIDLGAIGAAVFGFLNRILIPLGLHHVLNTIFWFNLGDFTDAAGKLVHGDLNRFFAGDKSAGAFMTGFFPIMMFGLPAAAIAMIAAAKPERRKAVTGMFLGLALTSFLTGITEPIEFAFMFIAPVLYAFHAILTGLSMGIVNALGIKTGFTFSAGFIDYVLNFNISQKPILLILIGLVFAVIYFIVFYFAIIKFNIKTPGREDEEVDTDEVTTEIGDSLYLQGLGGKENLVNIDNCTTRLRLQVKDASKVNESLLKKAGARGVIKLDDKNVQVVVGTNVEFVAEDLKKSVK